MSSPNVMDNLISKVKNNTSRDMQLYLLVMVPIVIILVYLLYKYNISNRIIEKTSKMNYKDKLTLKPLQQCFQIDPKYQYKLCDYYISSSFMTPCVGNQHYDYVSEEMVKTVIQSGARYIQIPICESDVTLQALPVVATAEYGQRIITSLNTIDLRVVLKTIRGNAFKQDKKDINYPLFVHLVLHTKNPYTLKATADNIQEVLSDVLVDPTKYNEKPIFLEKLCNLLGKIVLFATPEYIGTHLEKYIVPTNKLFQIYHFGELGGLSIPTDSIFTNDYNKRLSTKEQEASNKRFSEKYPSLEYIIENADTIGPTILNDKDILNNIASFNKVGMTVVKPMNPADVLTTNFDPNESFFLGCQFICMNFQNNDDNMNKYLDVFNESSFRLKPDSMRFSEKEIPTKDLEAIYSFVTKANPNIINEFYSQFGNTLITLEPYSLLNTYMTQVENNLRFNVGLNQSSSTGRKFPKPNIRQSFIPRKCRLSTGNNVAFYLESAAQNGMFLTFNNNSFILQKLGTTKKDLVLQSFYAEIAKAKDNEADPSKGNLVSFRLIDDNRPMYIAFENKVVKAYPNSEQIQAHNNMSFYVKQVDYNMVLKIITLFDDGLKTMSGGLIGAIEGKPNEATEYIVTPADNKGGSGGNFNIYNGSQFKLQNKSTGKYVSFEDESGFLYDKNIKPNTNSIFNIESEKGFYIIVNKDNDNLILYNRNLIKFVKPEEIESNENLFKLDISYDLR
jgi:hypothetical protein